MNRILLLILALWTFPGFAADTSPATTLVTNGDFETDSEGDGWPDGWGSPTPGISREKEDGKHFMRLTQQEPGKILTLYKLVPIPPHAKGIDIFVRYRTANVTPGEKTWFDTRAILHFKDASGQQLKGDPGPIVFSTKAQNWTGTNKRLLIPEGATAVEIVPCLFQVVSGTLDLDEIRVEVMSDADAESIRSAQEADARRKAEQAALIEKDLALPPKSPELTVSGNQVLTPDGEPIWLQGLSVDSMQWGPGENILWSIRTAIDVWKANVIRLPVHDTYWFGHGKAQAPGGEKAYRKLVDDAVKLAAAKGAYLVLDLHQFGAPTDKHLAFWKDAAVRYKNNPAVLFEIFNEPHGVSWDVWRNGGSLSGPENKVTDVNPIENTLKMDTDHTVGAQALVAAIRETGAKNIIVAGALDWAYDLSGIVEGYALDDLGGNGVMYVSHIYPWKSEWEKRVLVAADKYPIIITEIGCPEKWEDFSFIPPAQRYPLEGWSEDVLGMIQKYKLHWTGFSFHPTCGPPVIQDWNYTPTPFWGVYVKDALAGKKFELSKMR
jgi:endoglucanase